MTTTERLSALAPPIPDGPRSRLWWNALHGSAQGLAIANAAVAYSRPLVVVTADTPGASRLEEQIRFFSNGNLQHKVYQFPDWETLPYDVFSPHQDIVSERLAALYQLPHLDRGVLIVPVATLMNRLPPRSYLEAQSFLLACGERLNIEAARSRLQAAGYQCVGQVMEHGEFAVRGSLIDVYPMGGTAPYRIDLFDDEVESIRSFEPETQLSREKIDEVRLLPAREFPLSENGVARFRQNWRVRFEGDPNACPVYRDVSQGLNPAGIEYYLPLFFESTATLFDYLPENSVVIMFEEASSSAVTFWQDLNERFEDRRYNTERPLLSPHDLYLSVSELDEALGSMPCVELSELGTREHEHTTEFATRAPISIPISARATEPLALLERFVNEHEGRVLFVAESAGRREQLLEVLNKPSLRPVQVDGWVDFLRGTASPAVTVGALEDGLALDEPPVVLLTEAQLFGQRAMQRRRRRTGARDAESIIKDLTELSLGTPVVHEDHGVGRYQGLETLDIGGSRNEFLAIEYADGDKLYVPVSSLHLVSRYSGTDVEHAPLHKLGSSQWQKARKRAAERAYDVAAELLDVQARRASRSGHVFKLDDVEYRSFTQAFPFEETPDQLNAINDVVENMASEAAMDRLICGDVGFGKTEVAMRAAFVAVQDGWQVAILVPTTLLAQQHFENFRDRFADWPVRIEILSRFRSKAQHAATASALARGQVDIVIGTHKLLQGEVRFKRLGLVIIDEEHRFGVRQKERLKSLRAEVDVLTLTATPIPRTLNMALSGLRDLSLIATPPERRLSIKTFVRQWDDGLIREACLREIRRGGQVFFVHNRVEDIEKIAKRVEKLVPEASVRVAHGQMREHQLEQVMLDFYHLRFNLLVCTTIIETGIDVPSANTMVINRADRFGLAQLHQLRGRVGRSHHRAYAYLVVPPRNLMTADAIKRLEAIESLEDLGIGFSLATHDLEIRGAGELLGEEQSGQIHEVGYSMYTELLERAVRALKAGKTPALDRPLDHGAEIDLRTPALLPTDYLPDVHMRLIMYKRIANAGSEDELDELQVEMIDRFGLLPEAAKTLFRVTRLKLKATPLGIRKIEMSERGGRVVFGEQPNIDSARLIQLIQDHPKTYQLDGKDRLRMRMELPDIDDRISAVEDLLSTCGEGLAAQAG